MHSVVIIAIVFGSIIITFAIIPATILFAIKMFKGRGTGRQGLADEETKMIQEIYQSLSKMEDRIETLETLILERERKES